MAEVGKDQTQDAFREGLFVRALGRPSSSNPYSANSDERALWEEGWRSVDELGENAPPGDAVSRSKLVPDFMPGGAPAKARQALLKRKPFALWSSRYADALRILAVIAMAVLMLILARL